MQGKSPCFVSLAFLSLSLSIRFLFLLFCLLPFFLSLFLFFFSLLHRISPLGLFLSYFHFLIFSFFSHFSFPSFSLLFLFDPHPSNEFVNKWGKLPPTFLHAVCPSHIFLNFLIFPFLLYPTLDTWLHVSHSHNCTTWFMPCVTPLGCHVTST